MALLESVLPDGVNRAARRIDSIQGSSLDPEVPAVADLLALYGEDPRQVDFAVGTVPLDGGLSYQVGAVKVPGRDWAGILESLGELPPGEDAVSWDWIEIGGRRLLRATAPIDPTADPVYYAALGETLVFLQSRDEEAVHASAEQFPEETASAGAAAGELPRPGTFPLLLVVLRRPDSGICVGDDVTRSLLPRTYARERQRFTVMSIDTGLGIPYPYNFFSISGRLMDQGIQPPSMGPVGEFPYAAERFGSDGREEVRLEAVAMGGGQGFTVERFDVGHCLGGRWQDGDRVIRISPPFGSSASAEVISGEICGEEGGIDFTAEIDGSQVRGEDLKVCNPQACVDPGLLPASLTVPFTGAVADDGMAIEMAWSGAYYELPSCVQTDVEDHQFTITRLSFGD